jgi:uncharacterized protein
VIRDRGGRIRIDDAEEFALHQREYGYPLEVVQAAHASCDWLASNLATAETFVSAHQHYLSQARGLDVRSVGETPPAV